MAIMEEIALYRRYFKDSGYFTIQNDSSITAGSYFWNELDQRFTPYNDVKIINFSSNNILVTLNNNLTFVIPAGNEFQYNQPTHDITIKNSGSTTINSYQILISYRNDGFQGKRLINNAVSISQIGGFLKSFF